MATCRNAVSSGGNLLSRRTLSLYGTGPQGGPSTHLRGPGACPVRHGPAFPLREGACVIAMVPEDPCAAAVRAWPLHVDLWLRWVALPCVAGLVHTASSETHHRLYGICMWPLVFDGVQLPPCPRPVHVEWCCNVERLVRLLWLVSVANDEIWFRAFSEYIRSARSRAFALARFES